MFQVEERHEIIDIEQIPPTELHGYLSQFVLTARKETEKIMNRHLSAEFWLELNAI